jgi:hypothetical protein
MAIPTLILFRRPAQKVVGFSQGQLLERIAKHSDPRP